MNYGRELKLAVEAIKRIKGMGWQPHRFIDMKELFQMAEKSKQPIGWFWKIMRAKISGK